ncbi:MAG: hypothetical protein A2132_07445 [Nitrospirae bacterium RBG_16_43_11]|nr:MAG: hypothetical protein A2132_07445 [Nitrospirae bacterium RBG_16_43_11]
MPRNPQKKIFSTDLGIDLISGREEELFKWFLAPSPFWKTDPAGGSRTHLHGIWAGLVTPEKILEAGWNELVRVLDHGHSVRYDFSTAMLLDE